MIKKGLSWLDVNFEPILMSALFYIMTILIVVQVGLRYFLGIGLSWGEELSRIIFVWLMYFAISYATRNQRHIRVSFLANKTPEKV
ncbi:TRAP transporter small permease [Eubacterium aggregans]|uniref:TRAP transporter small permease n=1 Tax=Eubacterium aggregans TaxID=81409 RepID=UPI003F37043F